MEIDRAKIAKCDQDELLRLARATVKLVTKANGPVSSQFFPSSPSDPVTIDNPSLFAAGPGAPFNTNSSFRERIKALYPSHPELWTIQPVPAQPWLGFGISQWQPNAPTASNNKALALANALTVHKAATDAKQTGDTSVLISTLKGIISELLNADVSSLDAATLKTRLSSFLKLNPHHTNKLKNLMLQLG